MEAQRFKQLPILLREEPFGGLLFIPEEAVQLELDREAFTFLRDYFHQDRQPQGEHEHALLRQVLEEIGARRAVSLTLFEGLDELAAYPFSVYGAPTLADFQITERCPLSCPHCYASSTSSGIDTSLEDIEHVLGELRKNGVAQIALGGGEPLCHPELIAILELCHTYHLVPNFTTNGLLLEDRIIQAVKRTCGAIALSLEGVGARFSRRRKMSFTLFRERLEWLLEKQVATVLQVTLSQENFAELEEIVAFCLSYPKLYGVIFLAYKSVGRGEHYHHPLSALPPGQVYPALEQAFLALARRMRVGYDCCLTPGIVGLEPSLGFAQGDQLEGCSALRSSVGILPNLDLVPCTFTTSLVIGNLRHERLGTLWRSRQAHAFRQQIQHRLEQTPCRECPTNQECLGGCPVFDLVRCGLVG